MIERNNCTSLLTVTVIPLSSPFSVTDSQKPSSNCKRFGFRHSSCTRIWINHSTATRRLNEKGIVWDKRNSLSAGHYRFYYPFKQKMTWLKYCLLMSPGMNTDSRCSLIGREIGIRNLPILFHEKLRLSPVFCIPLKTTTATI